MRFNITDITHNYYEGVDNMDIMQAIMDIEQKAQGIVKSADELKEHQQEILDKEIKELDSKMQQKLAGESERLRREYNAIRDEEMVKTERKYAEKFEELEDRCSKGKDKWVSDIVSAVIGHSA